MINFIKVSLILGWVILCWQCDGTYKGAVAGLLVWFVAWVIWTISNDAQYPQPNRVAREAQIDRDFPEAVSGPSTRGHRLNPDPTRPTLDDYAGLITTYIERKRG